MKPIVSTYTYKIRDSKRVRFGLMIALLTSVIGAFVGCLFAYPILMIVGIGVGLASLIGIGVENDLIKEAEERHAILCAAYKRQNPEL